MRGKGSTEPFASNPPFSGWPFKTFPTPITTTTSSSGRKRNRSSKDGSGLPLPPPRIRWNFGGFCGRVFQCIENMVKNPHTESQGFCRTSGTKLSGTGAIPPYRAIGYSYTLSLFVFRYSTLSRYTPHIDPYRIDILLACKTKQGGYRTSSCTLKGIALLGGIAAIVSQYCAIPCH